MSSRGKLPAEFAGHCEDMVPEFRDDAVAARLFTVAMMLGMPPLSLPEPCAARRMFHLE